MRSRKVRQLKRAARREEVRSELDTSNHLSLLLSLSLSLLLLLLLLLFLPQLSQVEASSLNYVDRYVSLPKLGLLHGRSIEFPLRDETYEEKNNKKKIKETHVFGFLGIPYASPPVGLLRFMPPAALTGAALAASAAASVNQTNSVQLMPSGQMTNSVRDQTRFGYECVNLSDWIMYNESKRMTPANQSEDCLNLNVFVPELGEGGGDKVKEEEEEEGGEEELEEQKSMVKQKKSNHPSQSNYPTTSNNNNNNNKPIALLLNQETPNNPNNRTTKLWPLKLEQKLPVLVLFHHGSSVLLEKSKANSLIHAHLAGRTRTILITFNYRTGLLGFLPFPADGAPLARTNHAIWDQLGLLHWIKHNIVHFNGDPRKVTLLAADNRAAQFVQLIALTPLAKGLFTNIILVHDESREAQQGVSHLNLLISQAHEAKEIHRNLLSSFSRIIQQQHESVPITNQSALLEFFQTANLTELARVEHQVKQLESSKLFALASSPSLDDRILFPRFSSSGAKQQFDLNLEAQKSSLTASAELHYCLYMRSLYSDPIGKSADYLTLIPPSQVPFQRPTTMLQQLHFDLFGLGASGWHSIPTETQQTQSFLNKSTLRRSLISSNFEHLRHAQLLADQLEMSPNNDQQVYMNRVKRSSGNDYRSISEQQQLLGSFNLLVGYVYSSSGGSSGQVLPSSTYLSSNLKSLPYYHVTKRLINSTGFNYQFLIMLKLADSHFISTVAANESALATYCDFHSPNKKTNTKSTYAFLINPINQMGNNLTGGITQKSDSNWILDASKQSSTFLDGLSNFIHSGNPNQDNQEQEWPIYDSLNRKYKKINLDKENLNDLKRQVIVYLNLIPYLGSAKSLLAQNGNSAHGDRLELLGCLNELEVLLSRSVAQLDILKEESKCLVSSISRLRSQLRIYAADDIEPFARMNRQQQQQSIAAPVSPRTFLTTRSDLFAQQQFQQQNTSQPVEVTSDSSQANFNYNSSETNEIHENLKNLFTGAYKATVNRPLAFIVISGLVIFLLNLIIVLVIALRSSNRSKTRVSQYSTSGEESSPVKDNKIDGATVPMQLTSAIRTERNSKANGTIKASKQLKFDLPNLVEQEISSQQQQQQQQQDEIQPDDANQTDLSSQFLLNASALIMSECQHVNNIDPPLSEQQQQEVILESPIDFYPEWPAVYSHSSSCQQEQYVPHLVSFTTAGISPLQSLFPSQSTATTTTSGVTSYRQQSLRLRRNRNCQAQKDAQQAAQSPSSSTTLSMTPIQLESFGHSLSSPQQYQPMTIACKHQLHKDLNLPYQSNTSCEQGELFIMPQHVEQQQPTQHYLSYSDTNWNG